MKPWDTMPVERLVQSIGTSPNAVAGLRAMANELGGRRGQRLVTLASQIERGSHVQNTDASHSTILATSLIGVTQSAERLPHWFMLEELRDQARSRVQAVVWYSLFYCLTASVIGFAILRMIPTLTPEFDFHWWDKKFEPLKIEPIEFCYQLLIGVFLIFTMIWVLHQVLRHFRQPKWQWVRVQSALDWLISQVPLIGSAWAAIELAQISETLHQSLASRCTYPDALRAAALQTESAMLRSWLNQGAGRLQQGETFQAVMADCPVRANWLRGMSELLSSQPAGEASFVSQWKSVSGFLHEEMVQRCSRVSLTVAPIAVIFSAAIAFTSWLTVYRLIFNCLKYFEFDLFNGRQQPLIEYPSHEQWLVASAIGLLLWITLLVVRRKLTARPFKRVPQFTVNRLGYPCWVLALFVTLVPAVIFLRYLAIPVLAIGWTCAISAMVQRRKEELQLLRSLILAVVGGRGSLPDAIEQFAVDMRSQFSLRCRCFADCLRRGQSPSQAAKSSGVALAVDALVAMEQGPGKAEVESETAARLAPHSISKTNWSFDEWTSWSISNQLIYLAAIIVTLSMLPLFLGRLFAPLWTLFDEFGLGMNSMLDLIREHHANVSSLSLLVALIAVVWIALVLLCYLRPSRWLIRITPWFGDWLYIRRRCEGLQSLASGLRRGQPITEVLSSIEQLTRSRWIRRQTSSTLRQMQQGQPLAKSLLSAGYVNGVESGWIGAAATTGHLPNALELIVEDVTRQYELKWRIRLAWMVPAALLVMGAYVCIFVYWMMGTLCQLIVGLT